MRLGWLLAVLVAAVVLPSAAFGAAGLGGVTVVAGPDLQGPPPPGVSKQADALAFYPRVVTVHVGDTVTWQFNGFHTVTFAGPKRPYPFVVPFPAKQPSANDAAGSPMWWAGAAPVLGVSPLSILPQGSSTISSPAQVRSSGLLRVETATPKHPPAPYLLTFTRAGTYHFQCAVHTGMRGVVRVLPPSASVPSVAAQEQQGKLQFLRTVADVKRLNNSKPAVKLRVLVGVGHNSTGAEIASMFPSRLVVNVGDTVTFRNDDETDIHTVTFGPPKYTSQIEKNFIAPHGKQLILDPFGAYASDPPGGGITQYDGTNHGNGYVNAGLLFPKGSPAKAGPQAFKVTFTEAGVYHFECVIHQNMDGTIVVH